MRIKYLWWKIRYWRNRRKIERQIQELQKGVDTSLRKHGLVFKEP